MIKKTEGESWTGFMDRALENGMSPTDQEEYDRSVRPCCDSPGRDKCDQCQETGAANPATQS